MPRRTSTAGTAPRRLHDGRRRSARRAVAPHRERTWALVQKGRMPAVPRDPFLHCRSMGLVRHGDFLRGLVLLSAWHRGDDHGHLLAVLAILLAMHRHQVGLFEL